MYNFAMFRRSTFLLPIAWVLLFAVLFNIALSSMAGAKRLTDPIAFGDICTTSGPASVAASSADHLASEHANLLHDGHCQLCSVEISVFLPRGLMHALPGTIRPVPPLELQTFLPVPLPDSFPPPSHAPPVFS